MRARDDLDFFAFCSDPAEACSIAVSSSLGTDGRGEYTRDSEAATVDDALATLPLLRECRPELRLGLSGSGGLLVSCSNFLMSTLMVFFFSLVEDGDEDGGKPEEEVEGEDGEEEEEGWLTLCAVGGKDWEGLAAL